MEQEYDNAVAISIEDFDPEIYDCECDGGCGNGHIHLTDPK